MEKYDYLREVFERNKMNFKSFKGLDDLKEQVLRDISIQEDITIGGSMTVEEINIYEDLKNRGNKILWHWRPDNRESVKKDIYLASSNAITKDGKLVNMDGVGNRVSAMVHGYKRVFIIVGRNKITTDYDDAIKRMRQVAAPLNAKRLKLSTPCVRTGVCSDCNSKDRICGAEVIIHRALKGVEMNIYLVDQDLGF